MSRNQSMISARQLWQVALTELQAIAPAQSFQTWLKNTAIAAFKNGTVVIAVPSNFAKECIVFLASCGRISTLPGCCQESIVI